MCHVGGKLFSNLQQMVLLIIRGGYEHHLSGTDRDPVTVCIMFARGGCYVVLGFLSCFKCKEPLSSDSSAETDLVKRFPTSAKVFVSAPAGTRT